METMETTSSVRRSQRPAMRVGFSAGVTIWVSRYQNVKPLWIYSAVWRDDRGGGSNNRNSKTCKARVKVPSPVY